MMFLLILTRFSWHKNDLIFFFVGVFFAIFQFLLGKSELNLNYYSEYVLRRAVSLLKFIKIITVYVSGGIVNHMKINLRQNLRTMPNDNK